MLDPKGFEVRASHLQSRLPLMFDGIATSIPLIKGGKIRALAVTSLKRSAIAPSIALIGPEP